MGTGVRGLPLLNACNTGKKKLFNILSDIYVVLYTMVFVAVLHFYFSESYISLKVSRWIKLLLACLGEICRKISSTSRRGHSGSLTQKGREIRILGKISHILEEYLSLLT